MEWAAPTHEWWIKTGISLLQRIPRGPRSPSPGFQQRLWLSEMEAAGVPGPTQTYSDSLAQGSSVEAAA